MFNCIKKSFTALIYNCYLPLALALYLISFVFFVAKILVVSDILIFASLLFAFFIFSLLFFSGWFNLLRVSLKNNEYNVLELFKQGVRSYFFPFLRSILLFVFLFGIINFLMGLMADGFIGKVDFIKDIIGVEKYNLELFLSNLSPEQFDVLFKREIFFIVCAFLMHSMTLFWVPSIYSEDNPKKSSFSALFSSCKVFFKRPIVAMGLTLFSNIVVLSLLFAPQIFMSNIYFLLFDIVIFSCWAVFILMLIFSYYETAFANNCDNRSDGFGQE